MVSLNLRKYSCKFLLICMILVGKNLSAQVTPRISVSGSYLRQVISGLGGFSGELCLGAKSKMLQYTLLFL